MFVPKDSINEDGFIHFSFVYLHPANFLFPSDFPAYQQSNDTTELNVLQSYIG